MADLLDRYTRLAQSPDVAGREVARQQLARLRLRRSYDAGTVSAWLHVPLAALFEQAGNTLTARPNGTVQCGHEPVHGSRSGACLVIWPAESRWWCSSCHAGGDAVQAVKSLEGCSYRAALARLIDRYGRPEGWR
jgi:hypothetical protein